MTTERWNWTRYYLNARSRGRDYRGSIRYAIDRSNTDLLRRFS